MKLNKDKSIGEVVFIVEGEVGEQELIKKIFEKILDYNIYFYDKKNEEIIELHSKNNKYSKVFIIPAEYSAICKLDKSNDYFLGIFKKMSNLNLDVDNAAIYYLFDRDRKSNRPASIKKYIKKYHNSRDNESEMNGLFLLSYPSIESFYLNNNNDKFEFELGKEIKKYIEENSILCNINEDNLCAGCNNFFNILSKFNITNFDYNCLDNFASINEKVFISEEKLFEKQKKYLTLSLLYVSLIDLGIIEIWLTLC